MKKALVIFFFIGILQIGNSQIDAVLGSQLQSILDNSVQNQGNRGVSAYLIMPNGNTWNGTSGIGKQDMPISDSTVFHGASTTKLNVSILMLILAEENLIDLDESWSKYISLDVAFDSSITIRQLLNHTSGIADYLETARSGNDILSDFNYFYTAEEILEDVVSSDPIFPPGTNFQYSNSNYALAAAIIEEVTGNSIQTELRNRIWNPLGMDHTYFGGYESYSEPTAGVWWNFGNGLTDYSNEPTTSMLSYAFGAGNIVTCPTDLGILLDALLGGQLISSESIDEMLTFVPKSFTSWTAGYGLGIHHANVSFDDIVIGHDGYYTNLTDMFHSINHDFTLVTMTNTQTSWFGIFNPMYDAISDYIMTTEVNDLNIESELNIYPNPAMDNINIEYPDIIEELTIRDINGNICHQSNIGLSEISLSMNLQGVYFVTIQSGKKLITQKLMVIKEY